MKTTKSIRELHEEEQWEAVMVSIGALKLLNWSHLSLWERFKIRCSDFFWDAFEFVYLHLFP